MRPELQDYIRKIEQDIKPIDESAIYDSIRKILNDKADVVSAPDELVEYIAFAFDPGSIEAEGVWGTYYGPLMQMKDDAGQWREFPSIQQVDENLLTILSDRAQATPHPLLASRYADLVVDFKKHLFNKVDFEMAQLVIDKTIEICEKSLCTHPIEYREKLERAMSLAVLINDKDHQEKLVLTTIATEEKNAEDDKAGLWGYSFQLLLDTFKDKIVVTDEQISVLVGHLEERIARLMSEDDPNPWTIERAIELLAPYYQKQGNEEPLKALLEKLEQGFRRNKHVNSSGLLISNYLEHLHGIYLLYSQYDFARDAAKRILDEISNLGSKVVDEMKKVSAEVKVSKDEIDAFITSLFGNYGIEESIARVVVNFIPKKDSVEKELKNLVSKYPLQFMMNRRIVSEDGYTVAEIGSVYDDYDQNLLNHFSQNLRLQDLFLRLGMEEFRIKFSWQGLKKVLLMSALFRAEDEQYIDKLLKAYYNEDYLFFSSASIPLIEDAVRNSFKINQISYLKQTKVGYDVQPLKALLRHQVIEDTFQDLGQDMSYYLRVLLTEKVGWNLRNDYAHGITKSIFLSEQIANRLMHVLFSFSLVRPTPKQDEKVDESD